MSSWKVRHDKPWINLTIKISPDDMPEFIRHVEEGGILYWDHHGELRKIPNGILRDTLRRIDLWGNLPRRWVEALPHDLGVIHWDQTVMAQTKP